MTTLIVRRIFASGIVFLTLAFAALPAQAQPTAGAAWLSLTNLVAAATGTGQGVPPSPAQEAAALLQASQAAASFSTSFSGDSRAVTANKLAVVYALQSAQLGGASYLSSATSLANAFLANAANPAADRFDVALTLRLLALSGTFTGRLIDNGPLYVSLADGLYAQFGDLPGAYNLYLSIMRTCDLTTSVSVATKLQTMNAPAWAKSQAQQILDRNNLIGKALDLNLTNVAGQTFNLKSLTSPLTIVFVWSNQFGTADLTAFGQYKTAIPGGAQVIYLSVQSDLTHEADAQAQAPVPGTFCFDPANLAGWIAETLRVEQTPYVYIFVAGGKLSGFGRLDELAALVAGAQG